MPKFGPLFYAATGRAASVVVLLLLAVVGRVAGEGVVACPGCGRVGVGPSAKVFVPSAVLLRV